MDGKKSGVSKLIAVLVAAGCGGSSWGGGAPATTSYEVAEAPVVTTVSPAPSPAPPPAAAPSAEPVATTTTTSTTVQVTTVTETTVEQPAQVLEVQRPYPLLTAASVGDHDRRDNYLAFLARHPWEAREVPLDMSRRLRIRVVDAYGRPVNDARVDVQGMEHPRLAATGRTHADGVWDFYPGVSTPGAFGTAMVTATAGQQHTRAMVEVPADGDGPEVVLRLDAAAPPQVLDLAFLIDVTGSMEDELRYVNAEIGQIVSDIEQAAPETTVRVGATFYRDRTDRHVVQQIGFTTDVPGFARAMQSIRASGGGDYPEDLNAGLEAAMGRLAWTEGNAVRVLVIVSDAPPKDYADAQYDYRHALIDAQERGIRILPVAASGADRTVEYLFRAMGAFTSTPYVYLTDDSGIYLTDDSGIYLTDDSGIGNPHLEADTDRVAVEYFADLLGRMVIADLRGEGMHEPGVFGPVQ